MNRLLVTAIAIGLVVALTSIIQIALELAPREPSPSPFVQPAFITVTIPAEREVIVSPTTVTVTQLIEASWPPATPHSPIVTPYTSPIVYTKTVTTTELVYYVHTVMKTLERTVTETITKTAREMVTETVTSTIKEVVTETITLVNYTEVSLISMQFSAPPGSEIVLYPDNTSFIITRTHRVKSVNMLDMGVENLTCGNCYVRLARFGEINALELSLTPGHPITVEIYITNFIQLNGGALWIYIPGLREYVDLESVYVRVGDTVVAISRDVYRLFALSVGRLYLVRLSGIPMIDGLILNLRAYYDKLVIIPLVTPSYRPIQVHIIQPSSLLYYKLKNGYCPSYFSYYYGRYFYLCRLEVRVRAVLASRIVEFVNEERMYMEFFIDYNAYEYRKVIAILEMRPLDPTITIDHLPLDQEDLYTFYVIIT